MNLHGRIARLERDAPSPRPAPDPPSPRFAPPEVIHAMERLRVFLAGVPEGVGVVLPASVVPAFRLLEAWQAAGDPP